MIVIHIHNLCKKYGTLLIIDEVATGFGRTRACGLHDYCQILRNHIPLYRQQAIWERLEIDMPRSSLKLEETR